MQLSPPPESSGVQYRPRRYSNAIGQDGCNASRKDSGQSHQSGASKEAERNLYTLGRRTIQDALPSMLCHLSGAVLAKIRPTASDLNSQSQSCQISSETFLKLTTMEHKVLLLKGNQYLPGAVQGFSTTYSVKMHVGFRPVFAN